MGARIQREGAELTTSSWPGDWPAKVQGKNCPMCEEGRPDDNGFGLRIMAGICSDAYLQRAAIQRGYTVVVWRGPHVTEPTQLSDEFAVIYWREILKTAKALQTHYLPLKMNYQTLGNSLPHLHTHLLPRYEDDPAPGRPFPLPSERSSTLSERLIQKDAAALRRLLNYEPSQTGA